MFTRCPLPVTHSSHCRNTETEADAEESPKIALTYWPNERPNQPDRPSPALTSDETSQSKGIQSLSRIEQTVPYHLIESRIEVNSKKR